MIPQLESRVGRPRCVLAAVALAVAVVLAVAGCAAGEHHLSTRAGVHLATQRTVATAHRTFIPYDSAGTLKVPVARRTAGTCWLTSLADPTDTAYRCFAGNQILDPCFARAGMTAKGDTVACVADPWSKATVLTLKKALPTATPGRTRIWAFTRSDGAHCVAATGTVPAVAGRTLQYTCSDGTFASLNRVRSRRVAAVFAEATATSLAKAFVPAVWTS